jgi:hypothetical protein
MKFLFTVVYLFLTVISGWLVTRTSAASLRRIRKQGSGGGLWLLSLLALVVTYLAYASLARTFPIYLLVVLIAVSLFSLGLNSLVGAITGFGLPDRRQKIGALSIMWNVLKPGGAVTFTIVSMVVSPITVIGSLWVFWTLPLGSVDARGGIAFFHFTLGALVLTVFRIALDLPQVTSGYLDDDFRNSFLTQGFAAASSATVLLVYPALIFSEDAVLSHRHFGISLPPFWLLISLPFLLYLAGTVIPFFVGILNYRAQARSLSEWRRRWLSEAAGILKLPAGRARTDYLTWLMNRMEAEIQRSITQNNLLRMYYEDEMANAEGAPQMADASDASHEQKALAVAVGGDVTNVDDLFEKRREWIGRVQNVLRAKPPAPQANENSEASDIKEILAENRGNLPDWDLRFAHLERLLQYSRLMLYADKEDVTPALELTLNHAGDEEKAHVRGNNAIASVLISGFASVSVYVFKTFEKDIVETVTHLVKSWAGS